MNNPLHDASLIACPDCDLLHRLPGVALGAAVRCPRCNKELWQPREDSLNRTLALTAAHSRALAQVSADIAATIREGGSPSPPAGD